MSFAGLLTTRLEPPLTLIPMPWGKWPTLGTIFTKKLGQLFVVVLDTDRELALSVWYSTDSDRTQRNMLQAATRAANTNRWLNASDAKAEIHWLLKSADDLAIKRNDAVHAPASLYSDSEGSEMGAAWLNGHPRARNLQGKKLLTEFRWFELWAETLSRFSEEVQTALSFPERYPWPARPLLPTRGQKSSRPNPQPPQPQTK